LAETEEVENIDIKGITVKQRDYVSCPKPDCTEELGFLGSFFAAFLGFVVAGVIVS